MTTAYTDGASGAPAGAPIRPTILNGYAVRAPWKVAGVDYAVGVPSGTPLKDPSLISMAGVSVNKTAHTVTVTGNNVVLSGYDFSLGGGWEVIVQGTADTVRNSNFVVGPNQGSMGTVLNVTKSAANFSFLYNNVNGANVPVTAQMGTTISIASSGMLTMRYNYLHNSGGDMVDLNASASPRTDIIQYNLFENIGVNTGHADTIQWYNTHTAAGSNVGFNTVYQNVNQPGAGNGALVPTAEGPQAVIDGLTVNNDTIIQTAAVKNANFSTGFYAAGGGTASNIVIHDLFIDPTGVMGYTGSPWFPTGYYGDNLAHPMVMSNVTNMVTGAQVPVPNSSSRTSQGYYTYADASGYAPTQSDVYGVTASPASGTLVPGKTIIFTVRLDEAFTVTGAPTLSLNDGGTAVYTSGSGTNALVFTYKVSSTDTAVSTLRVAKVNLPAGTAVTDSAGNAANLAGAAVGFTGLAINPTVPQPKPVAAADSATTPENKSVTISVLANDSNGGGTINPASVAVCTAAAHGTTSVNTTTGVVTYTPTTGYYGTDTFRYTVADTNGQVSAPAAVTVNVQQPAPSYADGSSGAPVGTTSRPTLLNGYAARALENCGRRLRRRCSLRH
ncbi:MAG: Ig-like domain-containing protein [Rhodopila sp.]